MYTAADLLRFVQDNDLFAPYFYGIYSVDNLPLRIHKSILPVGFILNTDTANLPGKHWIAVIFLPNGRGEVFDSFGMQPPSRLQIWINKHCVRGWTFNNAIIQNPFSTLCGLYSLHYLYCRLVLNHSALDIIEKLVACKPSTDSYI